MAVSKPKNVEPDDENDVQDVELEDGVVIERLDPYGFWVFKDPDSKFKTGSFTSETAAREALFRHNAVIAAEVARLEAVETAKAEDERQKAAFAAAVAKAAAKKQEKTESK